MPKHLKFEAVLVPHEKLNEARNQTRNDIWQFLFCDGVLIPQIGEEPNYLQFMPPETTSIILNSALLVVKLILCLIWFSLTVCYFTEPGRVRGWGDYLRIRLNLSQPS